VDRHPAGRDVHALRLTIRRTRSVLWCLKNSSAHLRFEKLNQELCNLGEALGCVRELDVSIQDADCYKIDSDSLSQQRKMARRKLRKVLNPHAIRKFERKFSRVRTAVLRCRNVSFEKARSKLMKILIEELDRHIVGQSKHHRLRIKMKKVRYAFEVMGIATGPIKRLQIILGGAHDLEFLQEQTGRNRKVELDRLVFDKKAAYLIKPALRFAIHELMER